MGLNQSLSAPLGLGQGWGAVGEVLGLLAAAERGCICSSPGAAGGRGGVITCAPQGSCMKSGPVVWETAGALTLVLLGQRLMAGTAAGGVLPPNARFAPEMYMVTSSVSPNGSKFRSGGLRGLNTLSTDGGWSFEVAMRCFKLSQNGSFLGGGLCTPLVLISRSCLIPHLVPGLGDS